MVTVTACKRQRLDQWHYSPFDCLNNEYWRCSICLNRKVFGYVIILAMTNGVFVLWRCSTPHGVLKKTLKPNATSIWKEPMVTVITKVHSLVSTMSTDWRCSSCLTRNVVGSVIILAMTNGVFVLWRFSTPLSTYVRLFTYVLLSTYVPSAPLWRSPRSASALSWNPVFRMAGRYRPNPVHMGGILIP